MAVYGIIAHKVGFKAEEKYAGKTVHITLLWPALNIAMTNDIKVNMSASIRTIDSSNTGNTRRYNIAGQKVDDSYRGIILENGKSYLKVH